jgi:hypothetical protein
LGIFKELLDVLVGVTKLAAVAFIKDEHKLLILQMVDLAQIMLFHDGIIELLDGGQDKLAAIIIQLFY